VKKWLLAAFFTFAAFNGFCAAAEELINKGDALMEQEIILMWLQRMI